MFEKIDRVLICKLKFYGDVLLTTPVIASIRARYPHAKIDLLLYKDTKAILAAHKDINAFYLIEKKQGLLATAKNYLSVRQQLKTYRLFTPSFNCLPARERSLEPTFYASNPLHWDTYC